MNPKEETPDIHTPNAPNSIKHLIDVSRGKDSEIPDANKICNKILSLFLSGEKYSVVDISEITHSADPRGHIRNLRKRGYKISDVWVKTPSTRYKNYFLK